MKRSYFYHSKMKQKILFTKIVLPSLLIVLLGFIYGGGLNYTLIISGSKNETVNGVYVMANKHDYDHLNAKNRQIFKKIDQKHSLYRLQNNLYLSRNLKYSTIYVSYPVLLGTLFEKEYTWAYSGDTFCEARSVSLPKELKCQNGSTPTISKYGIRYQDRQFVTSYPILIYLVYCPVTCIILLICVLWHLKKFDQDIDDEPYTMSYEDCVVKGEYMRLFYAAFSHDGFLHLLFNMMTFCSVYYLELLYGSYYYFSLSLNLIVLTGVTELCMCYILIYYFGYTSYYSQKSLGFSGVLFALMSFLILKEDNYCPVPMLPFCFNTYHINLYFFKLPVSGAPFLSLLLIQILIPNVSFIGHLSGIILGYLFGWGWFDYITVPLAFSFLVCLSLYHLPTDSSIYKIQGLSDADEDVIESKFPQKYFISSLLFIGTLPILYFNDYATMLCAMFLCCLFFYTIVKYFRYHKLVECNFYMRGFIIVGFTFYITLCYDLGYNIAIWPHYKFNELFSYYLIIAYLSQVVYLVLLLIVLVWSLDLVIGTSYGKSTFASQFTEMFTYHPRQVIQGGVIRHI